MSLASSARSRTDSRAGDEGCGALPESKRQIRCRQCSIPDRLPVNFRARIQEKGKQHEAPGILSDLAFRPMVATGQPSQETLQMMLHADALCCNVKDHEAYSSSNCSSHEALQGGPEVPLTELHGLFDCDVVAWQLSETSGAWLLDILGPAQPDLLPRVHGSSISSN